MLYASHAPVTRTQLGGLDRYYRIAFNSRLQTTSIQFGTNASPSAYLALTDGYATSANNGNVHPLTVRNLSDYNAANNRLTTLTGIWNYDTAGNLTKHGGWTLAYDAANRMKTSQPSGGSLTSYVYDADGRRVKKTTDGVSTYFVYDAFGHLAAEYSSAGPSGSPDTHYLTTDHLGSTRLVTNQTGAVVSRHDYLPYGWELYSGLTGRTTGQGYLTSPEGVPTPTQRFTGKERDSETRLDYFGARYYSAGPGRFTSADAPFADQHTDDPQSWNLYSYVRNNPLAFVDSTGRCLHPYQAAQCGVGLGQRRMTPKEAEYTAKGVAIGTAAVATGAAAPSLISWGGALARGIFGWALRNPVVATEVAVGAVEAGIGLEGPSTHRLIPTGDVDDAARALATKLGGTASVMIEGLGNREFDTVSKEFVAQTFGSANALLKPDSFLSKTRREQIRATLSAAKETGRKAHFEFRAGAHEDVLDFIKRNAERVGVEYQVSK